jgi:hypothetical protein
MSILIFILVSVLILSVPLSFFGFLLCRYRKNKKYPISEDEVRLYLNDIQTKHEAKVRKQWLLSYFLLIVFSVLCFVVIWRLASVELRTSLLFETGSKDGGLVDAIFRELSVFLIGYYFAYKKRGTIWLLGPIIATPIILLAELFVGGMLYPEFGWGVLLFSPMLGMEAWLWVSCIRLRKVNALRRSLTELARKNKYFRKEAVLAT